MLTGFTCPRHSILRVRSCKKSKSRTLGLRALAIRLGEQECSGDHTEPDELDVETPTRYKPNCSVPNKQGGFENGRRGQLT